VYDDWWGMKCLEEREQSFLAALVILPPLFGCFVGDGFNHAAVHVLLYLPEAMPPFWSQP
jgi:hypothetical protein